MWADPVVTRYIGGKPRSREEAWTRVLRYVGHWALMGFGFWVMRERSSGRFVGEVGFADFKRDLDPPLGDAPEQGWVLVPWAHGRGLATEAVRATLGWAAQHLAGRTPVCLINDDNAPSIRVATKCGYERVTSTRYHGDPVTIFRHSAVAS